MSAGRRIIEATVMKHQRRVRLQRGRWLSAIAIVVAVTTSCSQPASENNAADRTSPNLDKQPATKTATVPPATGPSQTTTQLESPAQPVPRRSPVRKANNKLAKTAGGVLLELPSQTAVPLDAPWLKSSTAQTARLQRLLSGADIYARLGKERRAIDMFTKAYKLLPQLSSEVAEDWWSYTRYRLGLSYLRLAETQNCCQQNTPDSCIIPIKGEGIHTRPEGSQNAIKYFTEVLENSDPESAAYMKSKWLLNVAYMTLDGHPDKVPPAYLIPVDAFKSEEQIPEFRNIAAKLGLDTFNNCGGAIVDDFDNDGQLDIVTSTWDRNGSMRFFRNNGDGTFSDLTGSSGLVKQFAGLNIVQADYNNDGFVDIFVPRGAWRRDRGKMPNALLRNNGDNTFTDVNEEAGLGGSHYPTQTATWADYDNDGHLDLFVGNEHHPHDKTPSPCQLFHNNGDGTFTDVAAQAGVENLDFTKGVVWGDYNSDRFPDLYVSNMGQANRLYRNNQDGTFTDVAIELSVEGPIFSFPVWFWDVDNDGILDLWVSSYYGSSVPSAVVGSIVRYLDAPRKKMELACLYRGDGEGGFKDVAEAYNLKHLTMPMGANFGDLDNDGFLDFYQGTGYDNLEALMPNVMYRNQGGKRFVDVTTAGGFGHLQKGHGVAFADLDHDGDQDVFEQMGGALPSDEFVDVLYENPGFDNRWLTVHLKGVTSNRSAIGARIHVVVTENGKHRSIYKYVDSGGSFGANPLRQTIGLGKATEIHRVEVYWPTSDTTQVFKTVMMNQLITITEGVDAPETRELRAFQLGGDAPAED